MKDEPAQSDWAEFRESQTVALQLPETGMAVTIDLGEADDIHPARKLEVGDRLALTALKLVYKQDIMSSGPVFSSIEIKGGNAILNFTDIGTGLKTNDIYGYLRGFSIAGSDKKFYWAKAYIKDNKVYAYSEKVNTPVAVRYAWANNPADANLTNNTGLPAAPFRTDNWEIQLILNE